MSSTLCKEHNWKRKPINPVFFAPSDIQPGGLNAELQARLKASRHLIVICSPHSAKSDWVGKEISFFHSLGRTENIHLFIIEGTPHSGNPDTECLHPIINELGLPERLGANIHENSYRIPYLNREFAYVQLITKLLGIEVDSVWQRHKRQLLEKCIYWFIGILCVIGIILYVWIINKPVDISVSLTESGTLKRNLPPLKDATISIKVGNEVKFGTIPAIEDVAYFLNIPQKYMGNRAHIIVKCKDYLPVDTNVILNKNIYIPMNRDKQVYGRVHFRLWNVISEKIIPGVNVEVNGIKVRSDSLGFVDLLLNLDEQKQKYIVRSDEVELIDSFVFMPCGESDVIRVK